MTDEAHMPETSLPGALCYETLMAGASEDFEWPSFDENTASTLCVLLGHNRQPQGRALQPPLDRPACDVGGAAGRDQRRRDRHHHAGGADVPRQRLGLSLFHGDDGAKLVLPGPLADGASIYEMLETEGVTISAGVPTVWLGLLQYLEETGKTLSTVKRLVIGGSAVPRAMIEAFLARHGVEVRHAWGMTEMSPLGTINSPTHGTGDETPEQFCDRQVKQGRVFFGVEMKIVDDDDKPLPEDGVAFGMLKVRGPWVCRSITGRAGPTPMTTRAGSPPATWPPSIPGATCRSPTGRRT